MWAPGLAWRSSGPWLRSRWAAQESARPEEETSYPGLRELESEREQRAKPGGNESCACGLRGGQLPSGEAFARKRGPTPRKTPPARFTNSPISEKRASPSHEFWVAYPVSIRCPVGSPGNTAAYRREFPLL